MAGTGKKFDLSLVTPDGAAYEGQAEMIIVPGQIGEIGVLARHAPLIATLKAGTTRIHPDRRRDGARVRDRARLLPDAPRPRDRPRRRRRRWPREIDPDRAQAQLDAARADLEAIEQGELERRSLAGRAADQARREPAHGGRSLRPRAPLAVVLLCSRGSARCRSGGGLELRRRTGDRRIALEIGLTAKDMGAGWSETSSGRSPYSIDTGAALAVGPDERVRR